MKKNMIIKNIYICSDFLMTKEKEQFSNRRWLFDLLSIPLQKATGLDVNHFHSSLCQKNCINRSLFFKLSNINLDKDITHFYYDIEKITDESIDYLREYMSSENLIIGYELSEQTKAILEKMNIIYIDMWLHPIRFLDDIIFGFKSNNEEVHKLIFKFNIISDLYHLYANRIKVVHYKGWERNEIEIPKNSALFIGQMLNDKSVNEKGKYLSVLNYKSEFELFLKKHSYVFYSRHPYLKNGDEKIIEYLKHFDNVSITDLPTYKLLSNENIKTVMSVSSSVVEEAKYFGKKTITLFKPVICISDFYDKNAYSSVFQEFCYAQFWSEILQPVIKTRKCAKIAYLDPKDKLRDMLGFYWSYSQVDKIEQIRQTSPTKNNISTSIKKDLSSSNSQKAIKLDDIYFSNTERYIENLKKSILKAEIVSFDIFDTLIERLIDVPNSIFKLIEYQSEEIVGSHLKDFYELRSKSRNLAKHLSFGEEVKLIDRYKVIANNCNLSEKKKNDLYNLELELEEKLSYAKPIGKELFDFCVKNNKRIIIISDTFFPKAFVEKLLLKSGYSNWENIFLSSEFGALKDSGNLFKIVNQHINIATNAILHIGDNKHSDIKQAKLHQLNSIYISSKQHFFSKYSRASYPLSKIRDPLAKVLFSGLISSKLTSQYLPEKNSYLYGSIENFGYCVLGPIFFSFARWIIEKAILDKVDTVYFLSRDGSIVKKCYDILSIDYKDAPKSKYIYASRRSIRVAEIYSVEDINNLLSINFTPQPLSSLMKNRFGIDSKAISKNIFQKYGFNNADHLADWKKNKDSIISFFTDEKVIEIIIDNALIERENLIKYYNSCGIPGEHESAFVDIGHLGSLQAGIAKILQINKSCGYYFFSFDGIDELLPYPHKTNGYLGNKLDPKTSEHFYFKNILMYEFAFLNDQNSFLKIERENNEFTPLFLHNDQRETLRKIFAQQSHLGVVSFCQDMIRNFHDFVPKLTITPADSCLIYEDFLDNPTAEDIKLFVGICFENIYSGRPIQWIIPPENIDKKQKIIWKNGASLFYNKNIFSKQANNFLTVKGWRKPIHYVILKIINKKSVNLANKFYRDPIQFFADSSNKIVRVLGIIIYKGQ